jgi:hypothetical protein
VMAAEGVTDITMYAMDPTSTLFPDYFI